MLAGSTAATLLLVTFWPCCLFTRMLQQAVRETVLHAVCSCGKFSPSIVLCCPPHCMSDMLVPLLLLLLLLSCSPPPVLVMAHGMGAQKDIGLFIYAEKFVEAGMAVLAFDYRCGRASCCYDTDQEPPREPYDTSICGQCHECFSICIRCWPLTTVAGTKTVRSINRCITAPVGSGGWGVIGSAGV
jgi:hypothetical protein